MLAMLNRLNKIPQISFMAAVATSLLSILDPKNNSDPSLRSEPGQGLGLGFGWGLGPGLGLGLGLVVGVGFGLGLG